MASDKDIKIRISTDADTKGAKDAQRALEDVQHAAGKPGLESFATGAEQAAESIDILGEATKEEAEEFRKLKNLVDLSKASVESFQKAIRGGANSKGNQAGLAGAEDTLAQDQAALNTLKQKITLRVQSAKAALEEAAATKKLATEERAAADAVKERAKEQKIADQQRRTDERAEQQASNVRKIRYTQAAQALGAAAPNVKAASEGLKTIGKDLDEIDPGSGEKLKAVGEGMNVISGAMQGAAAFSFLGPIGTLLGGIAGGGASLLKTAFSDGYDSFLKYKEAVMTANDLPKRIEAITKAASIPDAAKAWKDLADAMDLVDKKLSSESRIRGAIDQSNVVRANEAVRAAELSGGDVKSAKQNASEVQRQAESNANRRAVSDAWNEMLGIQTRIQAKEGQIASDTQRGATKEEIEKLTSELEQLRKVLETAKIKSGEAVAIAGLKEGDATARNTNDDAQRLKDAGRQAGDKITDALETILGTIGDAANTPGVQEKAAAIRAALEDGFQMGEFDQISTNLAQIASATREGWSKQYAASQEGVEAMKAVLALVKPIHDDYQSIKTQVNQMGNRMRLSGSNPNY